SVGLIESDPVLRLTMLFHDIAKPRVCTTDKHGSRHFKGHQSVSADIAREVLSRLRFPTDTIETCITLIICHDVRFNGTLPQVKRVLNKIGVENMRRLFKVQYADTLSQSDYLRGEKLAKIDTAKAQFEQIVAEKQCFSLKQLAVNGRDLIDAGVTDGKQIGRLLNFLLDSVIEETLPNKKAALLAAAKEYSVKE
ncbi:MAG: HD domain-containing protein, partial [Eubacteriales bacterium]|nr:HD domain-containing protein [Eubacteriales bacterium]